MTRVRVDLNISVDGFATTTDQTPDDPFGQDWSRLTAAYAATRTVRERVFGETTGAGTTGVDDEFAARYFDGIGAEIIGAGMFGLHDHPDDPDWRGWWGDDPPFGFPVFVLTHERRDPLPMSGGTTFYFLSASPAEALAEAESAADGKDVRVGGGATTVRSFLREGLVDDLHVAVAPIVLGQGIRLWDDLRGLEKDCDVQAVTAPESNTAHLTLTRRASAHE